MNLHTHPRIHCTLNIHTYCHTHSICCHILLTPIHFIPSATHCSHIVTSAIMYNTHTHVMYNIHIRVMYNTHAHCHVQHSQPCTILTPIVMHSAHPYTIFTHCSHSIFTSIVTHTQPTVTHTHSHPVSHSIHILILTHCSHSHTHIDTFRLILFLTHIHTHIPSFSHTHCHTLTHIHNTHINISFPKHLCICLHLYSHTCTQIQPPMCTLSHTTLTITPTQILT